MTQVYIELVTNNIVIIIRLTFSRLISMNNNMSLFHGILVKLETDELENLDR